ncbi:MAG: hypothetical protein M1144_04910 [Candidatus Thermoplasmatota archaeon]|jgi:Mg-chelatase subunit ChlD|nr:hypothetical protein [Candidatus Thermoplasmatota archaeon]
MPTEDAGGESARVEDFRYLLPRQFGYELSKEQFALYVRIPFVNVTDVTPDALKLLERNLERWDREIRETMLTTFLIADKDFIEIETDRFLGLIKDRTVGPIREAVQDVMRRIETGRDQKLRRIINEISTEREGELLSSVRHGGKAARRLVVGRRGRVVAYRTAGPEGPSDVAVIPTIRAAIRRGAKMGRNSRLDIGLQDLQENIRYARIGSYLGLVVDNSTYDEEAKEQIEGIIRSLLLDAYERRDRVALVYSRGDHGRVVSDFTSDLELVRATFEKAEWGGLSPFASGVMEATKLFLLRLADTIDAVKILLLVTTGKSNVAMVQGGNLRRELEFLPRTLQSIDIATVVVDVTAYGSPFLREFATRAGAHYYHPSTVRYHKVTLANEMLSAFESGEKERSVEVGKAFLDKLRRSQGAGTGS